MKELKADEFNNYDYTEINIPDINPIKSKTGITSLYKTVKEEKPYINSRLRGFKNRILKPIKNFNKFMNNDKVTPRFMTTIIIVFLCVIIGSFVYMNGIFHHNVVVASANNTTIINQPNNIVDINTNTNYITVIPIATPVINNKNNPNNNPQPAYTTDDGTFDYSPTNTPLPSALPKPIIPINNKYIDELDYINIDGLNNNFVLQKNYNINTGLNLNITFQNIMNTPINNLVATVTIGKFIDAGNGIYSTIPIISGNNLFTVSNIKMNQYDTYTYTGNYNIPANTPKGAYYIIVNVNGDNGANCKISEIINLN